MILSAIVDKFFPITRACCSLVAFFVLGYSIFKLICISIDLLKEFHYDWKLLVFFGLIGVLILEFLVRLILWGWSYIKLREKKVRKSR